MPTTSAYLLTRRGIIFFYNSVINALRRENIDIATFPTGGKNGERINTEASEKIIRRLLDERMNPENDPFFDGNNDFLQYLRTAAYQLRFYFQGEMRTAAVLVKELLPERQDIRNPTLRIPSRDPKKLELFNSKIPNRPLMLDMLGSENTNYLNALFYEATMAEYYSAQLRFRLYEDALSKLEDITALWYVTPDSPEHLEQILRCRIISDVDFEGVPKQFADSHDEEIQAIRNIVPGMYSTARYHRARQHPLYRFISDMPDLLTTTISLTSALPPRELEDAMIELTGDVVILGEDLKISSQQAEALLTRFHHGHPIYADMLTHLRKQNAIIVASTNDLMRRFAMIYKLIIRDKLIDGNQYLINRWWTYLSYTNVMTVYEQHNSRNIAH